MSKSPKKGFSFLSVIYTVILIALLGVLTVFVSRRASDRSPSVPTAAVQTPAAVPIEVPKETKAPDPIAALSISELMPSNKSSLLTEDGRFCDWIELYNSSDFEADLSKYSLSCDGAGIDTDGITLAPGGYGIVFCSGKLPAEGGTVRLAGPDSSELDSFSYPGCEKDQCVFREGDTITVSDFCTPGYPNDDAGYEARQSALSAQGPLVINEVMVYNDSLLRVDNSFYDWVEIKNISSAAVRLSDYYLSDSNSERLKYQLPEDTLAPGALYIIYCVDVDGPERKDFAHFGLDAGRDQLFLSAADSTVIDCTPLRQIPLGGSFGRADGKNGFFYYTSPTPSLQNSGGIRCITRTPVSLGKDGVFNDVTSVTVELSGNGSIYYTTGGGMPTTSSTFYTGPFEVTQTCVIRAAIIEDGKLTGDPLALSYIINENHTVPVVSLVTAPEDWTMVYGSFNRDFVRTANIEYFDGENSFSMGCGFKLHGETSRSADKKSLKIQFKSRYDGKLNYDLFGNGITEFSSILLRAAREDYYSTLMRDNLMHQLAIREFPELPAQDYRYSVLYVNGKYWGIYNIREAHSEDYYASHYGYDPDMVQADREDYSSYTYMAELLDFMVKNPVSDQANYEKVTSMLNVDSVIGWSIIQAYSGNIDCFPNNVRTYRSEEDGTIRYALLDLDLGMFGKDAFSIPFSTEYRYTNIARMLTSNISFKNKLVSALSQALNGTMSNENVVALIDSLADEIRPEVYRDLTRWGGTMEKWESMIQELRAYVTDGSGRAKFLAGSLRSFVAISDAEYQQYFGSVQ